MLTTLITVFVASLLGSLHCAAMCGGLVSFTCGGSSKPRLDQWGYHLTRFSAYAALGAVAGHAGQTLNGTTLVLGWQNAAAWLSGGAMVVWAAVRLWPHSLTLQSRWLQSLWPKRSPIVKLASKPKTSRLSSWFMWIRRVPSGARGALLGLTSVLLPCGWLYAFVATAAGQGNALSGALLMAAFALGAVPVLMGLGGLASHLGDKARRYVPQLGAVVLLLLGLTTVLLRAPFRAAAASPPDSSSPAQPSCHGH